MKHKVANWFALIWTIVTGAFLLFGPVHSRASSVMSLTPDGSTWGSTTRSSTGLASTEGIWAYVLLSIPVLLAAAPLRAVRPSLRRVFNVGAAVVLGAFALLGAMSVGLWYLPASLALAVAAATADESAGRAT